MNLPNHFSYQFLSASGSGGGNLGGSGAALKVSPVKRVEMRILDFMAAGVGRS